MRAAGAAGQQDQPLANTSRAAFTQKQAGGNNVDDNASAATPHYTSDGTAVGHLKLGLNLVGKNGPLGMASPPAGTMSPRGAAGARSPRTMGSPRSPRTPRTKGAVTVVEPETPQDGLEVLMGKRDGVIAMLNTIRATLFKNDELIGETQGYADDTEEYDLHWLTYRPKGSVSDVLTYRGHEKALDLLRCFDRDHDDMLDFSDFRGYLEYFGRTEEYGYLLENRESWLNYVEDMFETDKKSKVTARGFLMHRQEVEYKYPLSRDLQKLGMHPLTTQARRFRNACVAFDRLDIESQQGSMDRLIKRTGARGPVQPIGKVPLQQLQLLLGDCGECLDVQRGKELMLVHNDHQRVMASLLTRFARKDLKLKPPNLDELEDTMNVYKRGFWAWFMSGRPKQESRWLERSLIQVKNRLKRAVRSYTKMADFVWKHTMNGIRRGLIVSQVFLPYKQQSARYEAGIKLGRTDTLSGGLMCTLKFHQFDSERAARKKMTMPSASGMAVSMDLLLKTDVQPQQAVAALASLKKVISEHFESEINKLPRFLSWQVFPAVSDLDNLKVLRVAIYLKADMHVDNLLKQLQLGFSLRDVMSDLVLELRTNLDLRNACERKDYVLSQHLGMRVNLKTNLCRGILSSLLREVFTSMDDVHQARRVELEHRSKAAQSARERTLETNPQATTRFLRETFKFHYTHRPAIEEEIGDLEVSALEDPATEALLDFEFNDTWGRRMLQLQHYIRNFKAATWDLTFADLNEALFGTAFVKALLPRWLTPQLISSPGAVKEAIDKIRTSFLHEIERIKRHAEESERRALERERAEQEALGEAGRRRKQREKEKADMVKRLQALNNKGLAGTGMQQPQAQQEEEVEDDGTRVGKLRKMRKEQIKTQKAMLDCYSALAGTIVAPHSVHVTSGRYRLYLHAESLDIWDVFLPVPREAGNKKKGAKKH